MSNMAYFEADRASELLHRMDRAAREGRTLRIQVGEGWLKFKVGEGMWSEPIYEDRDYYRDTTGGKS